MADFIPLESNAARLGSMIGGVGSGFGQGLGQGINAMLQQKMAAVQQKNQMIQTSNLLQSATGLQPEMANYIASFEPKDQFKILQALAPALSQQAPQQQMQAGQSQQAQQQRQQQVQPQFGGPYQQQFQGQPQQGYMTPQQEAGRQRQLADQQAQEQKRAAHAEGKRVGKAQQPQGPNLFEALSNNSPIGLKQAELKRKEQVASDKETKPFADTIIKEAKVAKDNNKRLERIEKLTREGSLGIPVFNKALKTLAHGIWGVGIDLTGLMTADAQELEKLSTDMVKGAKEYFGNRLTDADLRAFVNTLPNLSQTNAGRIRVIDNLKNFNDAAIVKEKTMRQIVKENNRKRPYNLDELVEERAKPELDVLADNFKNKSYPGESFGAGLAYYGSNL